MAWIKTKIPVPDSLTVSQRRELAVNIILYIQERSIEGRDKNEEKFPNYSRPYADRKGVSIGDVDLTDTGDMLGSLTLLESTMGSITIGFPRSDRDLNGKAEGNILGSYGREPDRTKARDFLGIDETILEAFISAEEDSEDEEEITDKDIERAAKEAARSIFSDIEFDDGE